MSQFGGGKPPNQWHRPAAPGGAPQLSGFPTVNFGGVPMVGMGVPMGMVNQAAFSSPNVLGMQGIMGAVPQASLAQQQPGQGGLQQGGNLQHNAGAKNQRTFVGVVTKMLDTYGFVDDDVFFQHSVIRGAHPRVNDKVMVEANYNPSMPFKWNAYRIQLLNAATQQEPGRNSGSQQQVPPQRGNESQRWSSSSAVIDRNSRGDSPSRAPPARRHSPPRRSSPRRNSSPKRDTRVRDSRDVRDSRRSPPPRRGSPRRSPPPSRPEKNDRKRERSPSGSIAPSVRRDSASPPRRRARIIPRYECKIQKPVISSLISGTILRNRYSRLYLPSDYVDLSFNWVNSIPLDHSVDLSNPIQFHVFHKDVEIPLKEGETPSVVEPEDADHRYSVKVLLLSHYGKTEVVKKSFCLNSDGTTEDHQEPQSLLKNLNFLVGVRGKELMGIGGNWSPSLDGADPNSLTTMIRTATRTTKALTGIDLSSVSQW
uniref:DBC1 domain-containing protein n=1 Tax=Caenorhabditis japonica TaxID=281687 RepID=A0A8R1DKM5_CAEJA